MTYRELTYYCYLSQAWSLALDNDLILDGKFEINKNGLHNTELKKNYKSFYKGKLHATFDVKLEKADKTVLARVWETYKEQSELNLDKIIAADPCIKEAIEYKIPVSTDSMKAHYKNLMRK